MTKKNYWPLLFIGIFLFTFFMIVWTIYWAIKTPVHEDRTFLDSYHDLDKTYNDIIHNNEKFRKKYDFKMEINKQIFALVTKDILLAQRVIEKYSKHKNTFKKGLNTVFITIKNKKSNKLIKNIKIDVQISRPTNHKNTMNLTNTNFIYKNNAHTADFNLPLKGNWNLIAKFKINTDKAYFYIKSNAQ